MHICGRYGVAPVCRTATERCGQRQTGRPELPRDVHRCSSENNKQTSQFAPRHTASIEPGQCLCRDRRHPHTPSPADPLNRSVPHCTLTARDTWMSTSPAAGLISERLRMRVDVLELWHQPSIPLRQFRSSLAIGVHERTLQVLARATAGCRDRRSMNVSGFVPANAALRLRPTNSGPALAPSGAVGESRLGRDVTPWV
jgi:hypothetical protein